METNQQQLILESTEQSIKSRNHVNATTERFEIEWRNHGANKQTNKQTIKWTTVSNREPCRIALDECFWTAIRYIKLGWLEWDCHNKSALHFCFWSVPVPRFLFQCHLESQSQNLLHHPHRNRMVESQKGCWCISAARMQRLHFPLCSGRFSTTQPRTRNL